jgi:hypothetical protein
MSPVKPGRNSVLIIFNAGLATTVCGVTAISMADLLIISILSYDVETVSSML